MTDNHAPHRIRLWDKDMRCIYDSLTDPRTPEEFMNDQRLDAANYSRDYEPHGWRSRDAGRLIRSHDTERLIWSPARDFLNFAVAATDAANAVMTDPGRFGADIPAIKEGDRVAFQMGSKTVVGTVKKVTEEHGVQHIVFGEEPEQFSRALSIIETTHPPELRGEA